MAEIRGCVPGGAAAPVVEPPAETSESTAAGVGLAGKTFSAFTDTSAVIASYTAVTTNATGSASWSGSGLGPYTPTDADGDAGTLSLDAKDAGGNTLATAVHSYDRAAAAGAGAWTDVLDWSASSETFAAGEATYTIGGLSVVVDWQGTAGPTSIDLASGVLTVQGDDTHMVYLTIDLGENFTNVPLWACISIDAVTGVAVTSAIFWQMADDQTALNANGHWQSIVGLGAVKTSHRDRYWIATEVVVNNRTITDIETTPTRVAVLIEAANFKPSFDQGTAALPTTGADLGTVGPNSYGATGGVYTTTNARNQRYMHLRVACDATIRLFAAKRS